MVGELRLRRIIRNGDTVIVDKGSASSWNYVITTLLNFPPFLDPAEAHFTIQRLERGEGSYRVFPFQTKYFRGF